MQFRPFFFLRVSIATALCAALSGCGAPRSQPSRQAAAAAELPETWDAVYMQESYVGYVHLVERVNEDHSPAVIESEAEIKMSMKRSGQSVTIETNRKSVETDDGRLISFREEQQLGPTTAVSTGKVEAGKLVITASGGERTRTREIELPDDAGGPFAPEHSLRRKPMKPGERRTIRFYEPMLGALASETLEAGDYEQAELLSGSQKLLRIESSLEIEGQPQPIRGIRWTDPKGETLKSEVPILRQMTYRATKEEALRGDAGAEFDVFRQTLVKLAEPLANARATRVVRYHVELSSGDPSKVFAVGPTQQVKSTGPHTAEITVTSIDPRAPSCERAAGPAMAEEIEPNSVIQSDDPTIVQMAREASGGQASPGDVAVALEEYVSNKMTAKRNYSTAFATAADVARTLEGDCTEHAVLLAALARASGVPARVAIGLVYSPADQGFAYHMWTEMLLDSCWVPLDATLGEGRISADHLKLTDSSLPDRAGFASFLPLAEVLGQLKIEVLEAH